MRIFFVLFFLFFLSAVLVAQSNRCSIKVNGKHGYIDTLGRVIIEPQFESALQFSENRASVKLGSKWGVIDTNGSFIISPEYMLIDQFFEGHAVAVLNGKFCLLDTAGKRVLRPKYERIYFQGEDMTGVKHNGLWAFFNVKTKKFITPFVYTEIGKFQSDFAKVRLDRLYGFINKQGDMVIEPIYRQIMYNGFYCGRAAVLNDKTNQWGYIDKTGDVVIPFQYNSSGYFRESKVFVRPKWGKPGYFIDTLGNKLFDKRFDNARGFFENRATVEINNLYGIIDQNGDWIVEPCYRWISFYYHNGWIAFSTKTDVSVKWGLLNRNGEVIVEPEYAAVIQNDGDCILPEVYAGNCLNDVNQCAKGYVNTRGQVVWIPSE